MARKLTYLEVKEYFESQECILLSKEYINSNTKLEYQCSCGNISKITWSAFKQGHRCRKCGIEKILNVTKFKYDFVKKYFEDSNCKLLTKEYTGVFQKLDYICSCGNKSKISFSSFREGTRCKKCSDNKKRFTYEYVKDFFAKNNCALLSTEYINSHHELDYICSCGNKSKIKFYSFEQGHRCKFCGYQKAASKTKHDFEFVKQYFEENGCVLLSNSYSNSRQKLKYICSCGNTSEITFASFQNGRRCKICGKLRKIAQQTFTYEEVKKYFEDNDCVLLSKEYIDSNHKLDYICNCGNKSSIRFYSFKQGKRCRKCGDLKKVENQRYQYDFIKDFFVQKNCILVSSEYINNHSKLEFICSCGNYATTTFSDFKNFSACKECGYKITSQKLKGENHYNYNPNIDEEERGKKRNLLGYDSWRKEVYKKDNYTCQCCGVKNSKGNKIKLHAHHKEGYHDNKELRLSLDNGITLCSECHYKFHTIYGKKNNNSQQIYEFISNQQKELNTSA